MAERGLLGQLTLDPFAGLGQKIDAIGLHAIKCEIQAGWIAQSYFGGVQANSKQLPFADNTFPVIVTSCTYGSRMADKHNARDTSRRITYKHYLDRTGEVLHGENTGGMQWTSAGYKDLHQEVWQEVTRVAAPGAWFLLNVSDHIRSKQRQYVSQWHVQRLTALGWALEKVSPVFTPRMRRGRNYEARVPCEFIFVMRKDQ